MAWIEKLLLRLFYFSRWSGRGNDPDLDDFVFEFRATTMLEMAYEEAEFYEALHEHKARKAQERSMRGYR